MACLNHELVSSPDNAVGVITGHGPSISMGSIHWDPHAL